MINGKIHICIRSVRRFPNRDLGIVIASCSRVVREQLNQGTRFNILGKSLVSNSRAVRELRTGTRTSTYFHVLYIFSGKNVAT